MLEHSLFIVEKVLLFHRQGWKQQSWLGCEIKVELWNYQEDLDWWHTVLDRVLVWSVTFKAFEIKSIGTLRGGLKSKQGRMIIRRFIQCVKDQHFRKESLNLS